MIIAGLALFLAFVAGVMGMRAALGIDAYNAIAATGLVLIVIGLVGLFDERQRA